MDRQSSSSASSSMSRRNYGAFLSFRGVDTRHNFISHLYHALCQKGVYTFKDSEELEAGQRISELFDAIEGSRVAVVTFSENYARSKWCLDELHKIMERKGLGKLTVIPIFYHVSPRDVRLHEKDNGEKGCYQIAMEEMKAKHDSETLERWRKALREGGDLIGIEVVSGQDEGVVVRDIVKWVMNILNRVPLEVAKHPVGIDRNLMEIRPLLHIDPHDDDVRMVGLLGPGGAGKTTLSKAICNDIAYRFDDWCFLRDVREKTSRASNGLAQLQQELLQELLRDKELKVPNDDMGKTLIKERLCKKRVLIILDDVEESNQLDALAGDLNWFGKGSRIILTTRNGHVLTANEVPKYEVNLLERDEADDLFRRHAFRTPDKIDVDCSLIDSFVKYAGNLPLALVVLGAFLRGRSESEWEGKLKELDESPDEAINTVLRISYDGLDKTHKDIFLDVACLIKGWHINDVPDVCGSAASLGLKILTERCLITIVDEKIQMHDLLVEMGRSISRNKDHGIPTRIWLYEDLWKILSGERERQAAEEIVEGIVLCDESENDDGSENDDDGSENDDRIIKFKALKDFKKLRILIIDKNVVRPEEPLQLPRELRWLYWGGCSAPAIEFYQPSERLVHLNLRDRKIKQINATGLKKLKYLNLSGCYLLETLLGLSSCRDLEKLNLSFCVSLKRLEQTNVTGLEKLKRLDLSRCCSLETLSDLSSCRELKTLFLYDCELKDLEFLDDLTCFKTLTTLELSRNEFTHVPASKTKFKNLQVLGLDGCDRLVEVQELPNVPYLNVAETDGQECFRADLFNSRGLDSGNINRLLSLEHVRGSVGAMIVIFPGGEFPHWVKFQSREYDSCYRVSLPREMLEDDIFGLALFISFRLVDPSSPDESIRGCAVEVMVNWESIIWHSCGGVVGVHSWFVYIPCQSLVQRDGDLAPELNGLDIALQFSSDDGVDEVRRWGMRLLCKREEEDDLIKVLEDGDDNDNDEPFTQLLRLRLAILTKRLKVG